MIKILTKNLTDNTNIDGARDNNFNAGRRSGIVKGALNEGNITVISQNTIALDTCELRLCGHRVVIDSIQTKTISNIPSSPTNYSLIAQIEVGSNSNVAFDLFIQSATTNLIQDNLDASGSGTYQLKLCTFTHNTDGTITNIIKNAELITGVTLTDVQTLLSNKYQPKLIFDQTPISGSNNPVTSDGIFQDIAKLVMSTEFTKPDEVATYNTTWKIEKPIIYKGERKTLKIIGGATPAGTEGSVTVWFTMANDITTNIFTERVLTFIGIGRNATKSTSNGFNYGTINALNNASLIQPNTGAYWIAIGI